MPRVSTCLFGIWLLSLAMLLLAPASAGAATLTGQDRLDAIFRSAGGTRAATPAPADLARETAAAPNAGESGRWVAGAVMLLAAVGIAAVGGSRVRQWHVARRDGPGPVLSALCRSAGLTFAQRRALTRAARRAGLTQPAVLVLCPSLLVSLIPATPAVSDRHRLQTIALRLGRVLR